MKFLCLDLACRLTSFTVKKHFPAVLEILKSKKVPFSIYKLVKMTISIFISQSERKYPFVQCMD